MSIRFKCPNGHELNVKDKYAGLTGLCPRCQARVLVPSPVTAAISEDAILDLLGPPPAEDDLPVHQDARHQGSRLDASTSGASLLGASQLDRGLKICPKCKSEVRSVYHICPHCRTYFTDASEVTRRIGTVCRKCNTENDHHIVWCTSCGADLRLQR